MARTQHKIDVNGMSFEHTTFAATDGLKLGTTILKKYGKPLADLMDEKFVDKKIDLNLVKNNLSNLIDAIDPDELLALVPKILSTTSFGQKPIAEQFDDLFAGQYDTLILLIKEIFVINFFFRYVSSNSSKSVVTNVK